MEHKIFISASTHCTLFTHSWPHTMPHNDIDSSLITSEPCKRKLTSYITNKDNASADKATYVKRLKETINPTNALTGVTTSSLGPSGSKPSTHSSSLEDSHINASGNVQTKHAYDVIASLDNDKIASDTPIHSGSHQSISIQKEKEVTHHMTVDTEDKMDTPIHSSGHQSKSIQKEKEITHHTAIDIKDETESTSDSY